MYFRYQANYLSPRTGMPVGLFVAVWHLVERGLFNETELNAYYAARKEIEAALPVPEFYKQGNPLGAAVWFKPGAPFESLSCKVQFYFEIMRVHERSVQRVATFNPGRVVYEDEFQVGAVPSEEVLALSHRVMLESQSEASGSRDA